VSFTITAPAPAPSGGGGSSAAEIETPATTPVPTPTPSVPTPLTPAPTTQPTATPGLPDNPVTQTTVASGLVLVSAEVAAATPPRVLKNEPTSTLRGAPRVAAQTGSAVSLVTTGLEANTTFTVKVKIGGKYVDLGLTETDANGLAQLPVFKANKAGEITVAIVNRATGETSYIKIKVNKKTKKN